MEELCTKCPRNCGVNRQINMGFCKSYAVPKLAKAFLHQWEEPCISGNVGSGTVFFSGCNLKCIYCQNYDISQNSFGKEVSIERLMEIYLELQLNGAHNINLVNPTHYTDAIIESILPLKESGQLKIPVVYNSNGYENVSTLKELENIVDVYLPDFKYFSEKTAQAYSFAPDYPEICKKAILEMFRQVGSPIFDENGIIRRGLIIRHLILPGHTKGSINILNWIAENLPHSVYVSLMSQYTPFYRANEFPKLNRPITRAEYERVTQHLCRLGLTNGYVQERNSSDTQYIPDFNLEGV